MKARKYQPLNCPVNTVTSASSLRSPISVSKSDQQSCEMRPAHPLWIGLEERLPHQHDAQVIRAPAPAIASRSRAQSIPRIPIIPAEPPVPRRRIVHAEAVARDSNQVPFNAAPCPLCPTKGKAARSALPTPLRHRLAEGPVRSWNASSVTRELTAHASSTQISEGPRDLLFWHFAFSQQTHHEQGCPRSRV